jgi:tetratricopeptide (TPR) repeat protein
LFGYPVHQLLAPARQAGADVEEGGALSAVAPLAAECWGSVPGDTELLADQISELVTWVETTNVGDGTIAYLDDATMRLAHDCLTDPPTRSYERTAALAQRVFGLLQGGHQRIGQTRDLYVIAGKLCAVLSWMSSDLGRLAAAEAHSRNGWILADEADHDGLRALLLCTQSKNAFWARRYEDAAKHARRGYEYKPPGSAYVLLACQEADAFQAQGRIDDAQEALKRAERAREGMSRPDELGGIFACGIAREANYSIATCLHTGSVKEALRQVERAETAWRNGEPWAYGTWAQVQIGAAMAYVVSGEMDGAAVILQPVLNQPAERRLATVTTRLGTEVASLLARSQIGQSRAGGLLREQITDYCEAQPGLRMLPAGGN